MFHTWDGTQPPTQALQPVVTPGCDCPLVTWSGGVRMAVKPHSLSLHWRVDGTLYDRKAWMWVSENCSLYKVFSHNLTLPRHKARIKPNRAEPQIVLVSLFIMPHDTLSLLIHCSEPLSNYIAK